ncbi:MAG: BlaI/MecI/CopY family transcriptional regulator [Oscillospiraceae bacterium]|nr:BlaI/MecI/CopY family transcriptional regulator [Oscillospiraceae bacterium]
MRRPEERISGSELELMKVLWEAGEALPLAELRRRLQSGFAWSDTTVKTLLRRLCEKGAVGQEKRNVYYYRALVSQEDYRGWAAKNLVDKLFRGSARELVAALVKSDGLSEADLAELREMFRVEA